MSIPQYIPASAFPADFPVPLPAGVEVLGRGGACIVSPSGEIIAGPVSDKEAIVSAAWTEPLTPAGHRSAKGSRGEDAAASGTRVARGNEHRHDGCVAAPIEMTFMSDGLRIAGHLRLPSGEPRSRPGLVFTGPLTGVKEQVTGNYAQALADAGYVTLAFDHRGFGGSEGTPRQHEDPAGKLNDLRDALSWLAAHRAVDADRIGCVGVCLGGGYALRFAAFDPRVRALVTVAGGYNDPRAMRAGMGAGSYRDVLAEQMSLAARHHVTGEVEYLAAVSDDDTPALMGGAEPFAYYGTNRSTSPGWENRITRMSVYSLLTADLAIGADFISPTPWLMVHGRADDYCTPEGAQATFARAGEPKEAVWLETTNHIDLYDVPRYVEPAVAAAEAWLARWL